MRVASPWENKPFTMRMGISSLYLNVVPWIFRRNSDIYWCGAMRLWSSLEVSGSALCYLMGHLVDISLRFIRITSSCRSWGRSDRMDWRMREIFKPQLRALRTIQVNGKLLPSLIGNYIWRSRRIHHLMSLHGM